MCGSRFKRNPIALTGFYVVCVFVFMALFADFIANDKPYYTAVQRQVLFPDFSQLLGRHEARPVARGAVECRIQET